MKRNIIVWVLLFTAGLVQAQDSNLPRIIPPSPNASAFHVYGNTQVNNYTGSANIQIPIFTIKEGDLTLPIHLKYTGQFLFETATKQRKCLRFNDNGRKFLFKQKN